VSEDDSILLSSQCADAFGPCTGLFWSHAKEARRAAT
jgi:hypothetical protein